MLMKRPFWISLNSELGLVVWDYGFIYEVK